MPPGLIVAAPHSDAGKTTVTLALLRALRRRARVGAFKCGPDYIDPRFHAHASGQSCYNLDPWTQSDASLAEIIAYHQGQDLLLAEGVMGLFDGAPDGRGSTAELARRTGWPVVLVVDCKGMADSIAALVSGFVDFDRSLTVAGVVLNRVGSDAHTERLREALAPLRVPVLGALPRLQTLALPKRHLGLLQADELPGLDRLLDAAADTLSAHLSLETTVAAAARGHLTVDADHCPWVPALGDAVAVARDHAFAFCYPHWLRRWQDRGVTVMPFSPLADEAPDPSATGVFLPGGYPELHAGTLAKARRFHQALYQFAKRGTPIYGECGGFMALGHTLIDAESRPHRMAGLLDIDTSFADRRLQLGYRRVQLAAPTPLGSAPLGAHEFHYSQRVASRQAAATAEIVDARGQRHDNTWFASGSVSGSYLHAIDAFAQLQT
ncbi:MAG: cobyrinate a,c-diamide synthase [Pseudomonadota bacterium]